MRKFACTTDGAGIAYDVVGAGPDLVFVHGLGDERSIWEDVTARLRQRFRCTRLDLRGHGESDSPLDFSALGLARDVLAVMQAEGIAAPALVGHSLGGFVAASVAALVPVRATVVVDQPLALAALSSAVEALLPRFDVEPVEDVLMGMLSQMGLGALSAAQHARLGQTRRGLSPDAVRGIWSFLVQPERVVAETMDSMLRATRCPFLSVQCCEHPPGYTAWLQARVTSLREAHWPDAGHFPHLTVPERLADAVGVFHND